MSSCQYTRCITSFAVCEITTLLPNTILACKRATQSEKEQNERKERRRCYSTTFIIVDKDKLLYNKSQINQDIKVSD